MTVLAVVLVLLAAALAGPRLARAVLDYHRWAWRQRLMCRGCGEQAVDGRFCSAGCEQAETQRLRWDLV